MLKKIGFVIGVLVAVFVVVGLILPTQYAVSREITINADQQTIHRYVGDLKQWPLWSPWVELDPGMVVVLGEKTTGIGASQSWSSDEGNGSLTFTLSSADKGIKYDLYFGNNEGTELNESEAAVLYSPVLEQTRVVWSMKGEMKLPVIGSYFAAMMDSMVGHMLEKGMVKLKRVVEKS